MDIKCDDARKLANTINKQLIEPWVILNYGPQEKYPKVYFPVEDSADIAALASALGVLIPQGLKVSQTWVRNQLGAPAPDEDEELLIAPKDDKATTENATPEKNSEKRPQEVFPEDDLDEIAAEELSQWERKMAPIIDPVAAMIQGAGSYEEVIAKLPALIGEMDPEEIVQSLAKAAFKARGLGDVKDEA
jgi:Mu-like prophage protein gp29